MAFSSCYWPTTTTRHASKQINEEKNDAVVETHSRGKIKLYNLFRKKGELVPFQAQRTQKKKRIIHLKNTKTRAT